MSAGDALGCWTVEPVALGRARWAATAFACRSPGSTPAFITMLRVAPSSCWRRATSRWIASVWVLPPVVAASWAASITSRLRVVNFSAPN